MSKMKTREMIESGTEYCNLIDKKLNIAEHVNLSKSIAILRKKYILKPISCIAVL